MCHAGRSSPSQSPPPSPGCQEASPPRPSESRRDAQAALCRQVPQVLLTVHLPCPPELAVPTQDHRPLPTQPVQREGHGPQRQCVSAAEAIVGAQCTRSTQHRVGHAQSRGKVVLLPFYKKQQETRGRSVPAPRGEQVGSRVSPGGEALGSGLRGHSPLNRHRSRAGGHGHLPDVPKGQPLLSITSGSPGVTFKGQ